MQHWYRIVRRIESNGVKTADGETVYGTAALLKYLKQYTDERKAVGEAFVESVLRRESVVSRENIERGRLFIKQVEQYL